MSKQSPSNLERGSVEKQKLVVLVPGVLSIRDLVVQTIFLSPLYSHIPIYMDYFLISPIIFLILSTHTQMNRAAIQVSASLTYLSRANFSKMLWNRESNPIKERVMSTPTWPVPYYQRIHRAYPVRQQKNINLTTADMEFNDSNWYNAKEALKTTLKGRQIVENTENRVKVKSYSIVQEDCESMARAYVNDISQFLDLANRENVKILGGKSLL